MLQVHRKWDNPAGGKVDVAELIGLLEAKALELQAADPALFMRIVGIDPAPQPDFRESMAAKNAVNNGPARYSDERGNTWSGKGSRPKWLKDALDKGRTLADFKIGQPTV